jgi:hypothetical protein
MTFELKEGQVALVISHADYFALLHLVRHAADFWDDDQDLEAQRLVGVLKVPGLEKNQ